MTATAQWERPKTTRRYLHPPKAERIFTLWAEGKVIYSDVDLLKDNALIDYFDLNCHGLWFFSGEDRIAADFRTVRNGIHPDGIPVHSICNTFGKLTVTVEGVSDIGRQPTCFLKVTLENLHPDPVEERFGFLLRTGNEAELVFGAPDVYAPYAPELSVWKQAPATWQQAAPSLWQDGARFVRTGEAGFDWDAEAGAVSKKFRLEPGESFTFTLALGKGASAPFDYDAIRAKSVRWWEQELTRLDRLPTHITSDLEKLSLFRNLTVQCLQCFCYPVGETFLLSRQGGLQRHVWPYESMFALEALGRIGSFRDYIEPVIAAYFDRMQTQEGEIISFGMRWAMFTANVLHSFAACSLAYGEDFYNRYREPAIRAFAWIRKTRASSATMDGCVNGLFPPRASTDCQFVFQAFTVTDTQNLMDLQVFLKAAERFHDPLLPEIRAEYEDYLAHLRKYFQILIDEAEGKDEIRHTSYVPCIKADETQYAFQPHMDRFPMLLELDPEITEKIITYGKRRGFMAVNGLYCKMPDGRAPSKHNLVDPDGQTRVWYTTVFEYSWFYIFLKQKDYARAKEILHAVQRYSMTEEGYMLERYHPHNPYYLPWSPNNSANGRLIQMLLDFCP